jgi:hypothetical protein
MPSGYTADLPADVMYDIGVFSHEVAAAQVALGATRGGVPFNKNETLRHVEFDGRRVGIAGLDRIVDSDPTFEMTLVHIDEAKLVLLLPGSAKVTAGTPAVHTITPIKNSTTIVKGVMLVKPRLTYARAGGGTVYIQFPLGLVTEWTPTGVDKDEAQHKITVKSRLDPAAVGFTTDDPGYIVVVNDPV